MESADELRERLRNERKQRDELAASNSLIAGGSDSITTSSTSRDIEQYSPDFGIADQRNERPLSGLHNGIRGTQRTASNTKRKLADLAGSLAQVNHGERQSNRRSSQNNGQDWSDGTDVPGRDTRGTTSKATIRSVGNLETSEPIPERTFTFTDDTQAEATSQKSNVAGSSPTRKRGRPPKQKTGEAIAKSGPSIYQKQSDGTYSKETYENYEDFDNAIRKKFLTIGGKTLTEREAKELKEPLIAAIEDEFKLIDRLIWSYTGDPIQQPIWSDLSDKEIDSLTGILLKLGQKSPVVATVARTAVDGSDYVVTGMVLAPRFQQTVDVVRKARKQKAEEAKNDPNYSRQSAFDRIRERRKQTHSVRVE